MPLGSQGVCSGACLHLEKKEPVCKFCHGLLRLTNVLAPTPLHINRVSGYLKFPHRSQGHAGFCASLIEPSNLTLSCRACERMRYELWVGKSLVETNQRDVLTDEGWRINTANESDQTDTRFPRDSKQYVICADIASLCLAIIRRSDMLNVVEIKLDGRGVKVADPQKYFTSIGIVS